MAGSVGRNLTLSWNSVAMKGVREKSVTLNGEAIDLTSGEDNGVRLLATAAGQDQVDISVAGVTKDEALRADWFAGTRTRAVAITWPNGATLTGNFFLSNYKDTGPYQDAATFDATLMSTGAWVYTPGS